MATFDVDRLSTHLGIAPGSIKQFSSNDRVVDLLQRWPTLRSAHESFVAASRRRLVIAERQRGTTSDNDEPLDSFDMSPASRQADWHD